MTTIIIAIVSAAATGYIVYRCLRPRLQNVVQLDQQTQAANEEIKQVNEHLEAKCQDLHEQVAAAKNEYDLYRARRQVLEESIAVLNNNLKESQKTAETVATDFYNTHLNYAKEQLEAALNEEAENYQESIQAFLKEYNEIVQENLEQREDLRKDIARLTAIQNALVEEAKRKEEMNDKQNFYLIQLSAADLEEIAKLRSVAPCLRNQEPLNKVIWKVYYEKPLKALIGRVIGSGVHVGIYKITDIDTGKCYVGQSKNISDRWIQHVKRGIGAEAPTKNKLYPAMMEIGPENFTFEVLEECKPEELDEREDFYQDVYQAKTFGYSIK